MASNELVTLKRYHVVKETEKGVCVHLDFMFDTTMEGGASVWLPKSQFNNGMIPRWLVAEKEEELAAEGNYKSCEILIDEKIEGFIEEDEG